MFEHIIFAHNDVETRDIFYDIFTNLGYKITTSPTHKEIMELLKKERPDYIILDSKISDVSADIVADKIKTIDTNIKIIILPYQNNKPHDICKDLLKTIKDNQDSMPTVKEKNNAIQLKADILIVDDDQECAQLLRNYLAKKYFNVEVATSGEEAIMKLNISRPDIVLLDVCMPRIDGILVLKAIKERDDSIIVIMTTAAEDDKLIAEAMKLGANAYLVKPFGLEKLEDTILNVAFYQ